MWGLNILKLILTAKHLHFHVDFNQFSQFSHYIYFYILFWSGVSSLTLYIFTKVCEKADLLCACYHLLENIIIYLTTSPSLLLDEKQILQLHSAMLGAFHSIIFFLKELSDENNAKGQVLSFVC